MGRPKGARTVSPVLKSKVLDLLQAGKSYAYVSEYYSISKNTIKCIARCKKYVTEGVQQKPFGRKPKLGPRCVRRLLNYVRENSKLPLYAIAVRFRTLRGSNLSDRTIRRYLHKNEIQSYVAAVKPYLNTKHVTDRLNWCVLYQQWTMQR